MSKFVKPKPLFNRDQAIEGVWYLVEDDVNEYGSFKLGLLNETVPRVRAIQESLDRSIDRNLSKKSKKEREEANIRKLVELIIDACLLDWDIVGSDGKPIPFTRDNAVEYFMTHEVVEGVKEYTFDYVFGQINAFVRDHRNFRSDDQNKAGDPLKN